MLYGKADQEQAVAALAGAPAYANQFVAPSKQALNGHASAPWITGEQSGSEQVAASPGTGREGPLNISWRGQSSYEEARTGRIFNLRRPERYPAAVLNAESVSEGATPCLLHCSCIRAVAISFITDNWQASLTYSVAAAVQHQIRKLFIALYADFFPCISAVPVVRGVKLAAERGLKVAIRSGGHSWAALSSVCTSKLARDAQCAEEILHILTASETNPCSSTWAT